MILSSYDHLSYAVSKYPVTISSVKSHQVEISRTQVEGEIASPVTISASICGVSCTGGMITSGTTGSTIGSIIGDTIHVSTAPVMISAGAMISCPVVMIASPVSGVISMIGSAITTGETYICDD